MSQDRPLGSRGSERGTRPRASRFRSSIGGPLVPIAILGAISAAEPALSAGAPPPIRATSPPVAVEVAVRPTSVLLDENRIPLPPDRQVHTAVLTWPAAAGFRGSFEVEYRRGLAGPYLPLDEATASATGGYRLEHRVDLLDQHCYRIRAREEGVHGEYSPEVCTERPRFSGLGVAPAPGPPATGTGLDEGSAPPLLAAALLWVATAALAFSLGASALCRR